MKSVYAAFVLLAIAVALSAQEPVGEFAGATPLEWSSRLARSECARRGESLMSGGSPKARWDYTSGLFALALRHLGQASSDPKLIDFGDRLVTSFVTGDGAIRTYQEQEYNLDMITSGRVLLELYEQAPADRWRRALAQLRHQLASQPRTADGGFWHKQRYPQQMWLDGLYMASPFYAQYGRVFQERAAFDEVTRQILLIDQHLYDPATGLYYHAWDAAHQQPWADPVTGHSPSFWGRSIGWYAMAVVDVLDDLPPTHPDAPAVNDVLRRIAAGLVKWQDSTSGVWYQVVDQGGKPGNYLEASFSSMAVYALAKGINRGYLPRDPYLPVVLRAYAGLVREFVRTDANEQVSLNQICEVAGLGFTTANGRARDGSFAYYISEPVVANDLKGVGPFILAGIEVQALLKPSPKVTAASIGWPRMEAVLGQIHDPSFPATEFPITAYGAQAGQSATQAIATAIEACHRAGGGHVVIPPGNWPTGPIHLKSHVDLHLAAGATLAFSTRPSDYVPLVFTRYEGVECMNYSPLIYAFEADTVAVTGQGVLDGGADATHWWDWKSGLQKPGRDRLFHQGEAGAPVAARVYGEGGYLRPPFIQAYRCKNVLIEGVSVVRSPMWEIHPVLCENVIVRGVKIDSHGPNNDGCDPESCRQVLIEDCVFDTGDDCIAIKSGRNQDGRRLNVPSEDIIIRRCVMKDGHGGVVIGSEISGGARNVFVEDCTMDSPRLDRALRIKSNAQRGGTVESVFLRRAKIGRVADAIVTVDLLYEEGANGAHPPTVRNIVVDTVTADSCARVLSLVGFPGASIEGISLRNCVFKNVGGPDRIEGVGRIDFSNVNLPAVHK